jgi:hypothetical protein
LGDGIHKNSSFQSTERLVVKLFEAPGKPRPKEARGVLAAPEKGAENATTVQTSKTAKTQQLPALQRINTVLAWAVHWQNSENPFVPFGELP